MKKTAGIWLIIGVIILLNLNGCGGGGPAMPSLPAPTALTATAVSRTSIDLTWADGADNESGFKIERRTEDTTTFTEIGMTAPNAGAFSDTGLLSNTVYYYRVRAYNGDGHSAYSAAAQATTFATLGDLLQMMQIACIDLSNWELYTTPVSGPGLDVMFVGFSLDAPFTVALDTDGTMVTIVYTIPVFYLNVEVAYMTESHDGSFVCTDVVTTVRASTTTALDGRIQISAVTSCETSYNGPEFDSPHIMLESIGDMLTAMCGSHILSSWNGFVTTYTTDLISSLPPFCLDTL